MTALLFLLTIIVVLALVVLVGPRRELVRRPDPEERCEVKRKGPIEHASGFSFAQRLGLGRFRRAPTLAERGYAGAVREARRQAGDAHALPRPLAEGTAVAVDNYEMSSEIAPAAGGHAPPLKPPGVTPENDRPEHGAGPQARQVPPPSRPEPQPTAGDAQALEQHPPKP